MNKIITLISASILFLIGGFCMFSYLLNIDKSGPRIVTTESPITIAGVLMRTSTKTIMRDAGTLGKRYKSVKDRNIVKHNAEPRGFAAVSRNFSSGGDSWDYIMGDVVSSTKDQPEELTTYTIPTGTYAVFRIAPRAKFL